MSVTLAESPRLGEQEALCDTEISVVMPCLNEARTVGRCVDKAREALRRAEIEGEVIVADNGSTDGSPEIARSMGPGSFKWNDADTVPLCKQELRLLTADSSLWETPTTRMISVISSSLSNVSRGIRHGHGQSIPGRHPAWRHAEAAPLLWKSTDDGNPEFPVSEPHPRRPVRSPRVSKKLVRSSCLSAPVWSSRARWWPRLAFSVKKSPKYRSSFTPTVEAATAHAQLSRRLEKPSAPPADLPALPLFDPFGTPHCLRPWTDGLADSRSSSGERCCDRCAHHDSWDSVSVPAVSDALALGLRQDVRLGERNTPRRYIVSSGFRLLEPGAGSPGRRDTRRDRSAPEPLAGPRMVSSQPGAARCPSNAVLCPLGLHGVGARGADDLREFLLEHVGNDEE